MTSPRGAKEIVKKYAHRMRIHHIEEQLKHREGSHPVSVYKERKQQKSYNTRHPR
jgi:hypothetical protein